MGTNKRMNRLAAVNQHFAIDRGMRSKETVVVDGKTYTEVIDHHPDREIQMFYYNTQGWGYADSGFEYDKTAKAIKIKGTRYMFGG